MIKIIWSDRFVIVMLVAISMVIAAVISRNYWGYILGPPPAESATMPFATIDSLHFVRYDAEYQPQVIPLADIPLNSVTDYPPTRVLPSIRDRVLPDVITASQLDAVFTDQLAEALRTEQVQLGAVWNLSPEPIFCSGDACSTDIIDLPKGQGCSWRNGYAVQPDGNLVMTIPIFDYDAPTVGCGFTGETTAHLITPQQGSSYFRIFGQSGFVIQGTGWDNESLVLANLTTSTDNDDHYRYDEFLFEATSDGLQPRAATTYYFDVAGIEGVTFPVIALFIFVPLASIWLLFMFFLGIFRRLYRLTAVVRQAR